MADSAKREKIAAARKKLKQFQKTGKGSKSKDNIKQKHNKDCRDSIENLSPVNILEETNHTEVATSIEETQDTAVDNSVSLDPSQEVENITQNSTRQEVFIDENKDNRLTSGHKNAFSIPVAETQYSVNTADKNNYQQVTEAGNLFAETDYRQTASTESLHQLSRQINGILAESPVGFEAEHAQSEILELENRNRELANLLSQHVKANEQLTVQNEQIRQHAILVQSQLEQQRSEFQQRVAKEIGPLKEQLQVHIQTIGILVAEKTELQSQLTQSHKLAEQRLGEVEDLSGRLKTSRQRVADLERSLSTTSNSSLKLEETNKASAKEIDRLKLDLFKLQKSQDDLKQSSSEVTEKLKAKTSEYSGLQHSLGELKKRLEMAELYNQQLSNQNEAGTQQLQIVEQLQKERDSIVEQLQQYTESYEKVSVEKDELTEQYKHYMEQLQNHNKQLASQIGLLTEEREQLVNQNHDLETAVLELQRKLEDVSSQEAMVDESAVQDLKDEVLKLQLEYTDLSGRHEAQIRDNSQLSRLLEEKENKLLELETRLEELGDLAGDKAELLENIQSDKTALSRALTQNKDLKQQLAELQNGFVKMSNDNMEMLSQLQTEQHTSRDLHIKLAQQEDELKDIREMLSQKTQEVVVAQQNSAEAHKAKLLHEQIQDRLRHYEAQAQLVETLQKELHSAQDIVDALTTQNSELRSMLIRATETKRLNPDDNVENAQRQDVIVSLQATIQQLESERSHMLNNLNKQREMSDTLSVRISDLQEEVVQTNASSTETDKVSRSDYEKMKFALEKIQEKYNRVMRDKADLTDKADELEHLVLQLQGETDTIGEYISLYHHQRALLQQRELQKNEYIKQLARDREELQDKLGELQTLVMQLMGEKNMLQSYQRESSRPMSPLDPGLQNISNNHDDWPDYTSSESDTESEVETIVGGKDDVHLHGDHEHMATDNSSLSEHKHSHVPHSHHPDSEHGQGERLRTHSRSQDVNVKDEVTAHKILNLLSEIGHSNFVDSASFMEKQFHPCKYCKGRLQIL